MTDLRKRAEAAAERLKSAWCPHVDGLTQHRCHLCIAAVIEEELQKSEKPAGKPTILRRYRVVVGSCGGEIHRLDYEPDPDGEWCMWRDYQSSHNELVGDLGRRIGDLTAALRQSEERVEALQRCREAWKRVDGAKSAAAAEAADARAREVGAIEEEK